MNALTIIAWTIVALPVVSVIGLVTYILTDGFKPTNTLIALAVLAAMCAFMWAVWYLSDHYTKNL